MMNEHKSNQFLNRKNLLAIASTIVLGTGSQVVAAQSMSDRVQTLEKELKALKSEQEKSNVVATYKGNRLGFSSADGNFEFNLNGRFIMDTAWADTDDDSRDLGQETFIRAARFSASGKLYRDWRYKLMYDFGRSGASGIGDAYLQYHGFKPGGNDLVLGIGNQFQPFGFEGLQSFKYITMMEFSGPAQVLGSGARRLGIRADLVGDNWGWAAGVAQGVPGRPSPQDDDDELDIATKLWFAPVLEKGRLVHVGASLRQFKTRGSKSNGVRPRASAENRVDGFRPVDTGVIGETDGFVAANIEAGFTQGPLNINAEYYRADYEELENAGANTGEEPSFSGATLTGSYYLTGESRPYSPKMGGVYGPVRPNNPLSMGGIGAWSVSARFSTLDLSDGNIDGGKMDVASLGLNWFPERRLRFSINAGLASVEGGPNDGSDPTFLQARTQVEW